MIEVQTMFLKMMSGVSFNQAFLDKHQIDGFLKVPMSVESFEVPQSMIAAAKSMLDEFAGIGAEANASTNEALLKELRKHSELLMQFPDKAQ